MQTTDTTQSTWRARLDGLANRTLTFFFPNGTLYEAPCETSGYCTADMQFFKGVALRSLASAAQLAPYLRDSISSKLRTTAEAAVKTCDGGKEGRECAFRWAGAAVDEDQGVEAKITGAPVEIDALSAVLVGGLLDEGAQRGIVTNATARAGGGSGGVGSGSGSGSEGAGGGSGGNGDGKNAGASVKVGMGLLLAGLVAALL
jgi:mannan endo-1,6-alpha-mannosidase